MTRRNPDIEGVPTVVSFVADSDSIKKFKDMVGDQNFSREIRAMIKDRVNLQKNEQASSIDPLNLVQHIKPSSYEQEIEGKIHRQSTLFEAFGNKDRRTEISNFVKHIDDMHTLRHLVNNSRCLQAVAATRVKRIGQRSD